MFNPTAFEVLVQSGIVEEMYKFGLLHDRKSEEIDSFLKEVMAKKMGFDLSAISEEARRNVLTKIEEQLQKFDEELIQALEQIEGKDKWGKLLADSAKTNGAKRKKRVLVFNPYLKETLPTVFSKQSPRPEARSF